MPLTDENKEKNAENLKKNEDESWFNSINNNFIAYKKGFSNFIENRDNWAKI